MTAERSFWPTLLFLWRRRGRFGLLYSSHGDNEGCTMKVVLLIYYHEKASNLTTSEPSPREVVCRVADGKAKLYIQKRVQDARDGNVPLVAGRETEISARRDAKRKDARDGNFRSLQCSRRERPLFVMIEDKTRETENPLVATRKTGNSRLSQ